MRRSVLFYNCAPPSPTRGSTQLARELTAMVDDKPIVLALCETIFYALPQLPGYRRFRDTSTPGRNNIAAYVRNDHPVTRETWFDMQQTWLRTEGPGRHPARAWLELRFDGMQALFGHQPPKLPPRSGGIEATLRCQQEGIDFLTERCAPWTRDGWSSRSASQQRRARVKPRLVIADWNRGPNEEGPGQKMLAERLGNGLVSGTHIDSMVSRSVPVISTRYDNTFEGVHLGTDHPWGAFRVELDAA